MTAPVSTPTQVRHPMRASVRTVVAVVIAVATLLPYVFTGTSIETAPAVVQLLAVAGAITRIMAIPAVNDLLTSIGLGATPPKS